MLPVQSVVLLSPTSNVMALRAFGSHAVQARPERRAGFDDVQSDAREQHDGFQSVQILPGKPTEPERLGPDTAVPHVESEHEHETGRERHDGRRDRRDIRLIPAGRAHARTLANSPHPCVPDPTSGTAPSTGATAG